MQDYSRIYFKPTSPRMTSEQYKIGLRKGIVEEGFQIVANIGD